MALYLYCIKNREEKKTKIKGIDSKSMVFSIPCQNIQAMVSKVDFKKFGSKEIAQKAKEDLKWIITYSQKHEDIIEKIGVESVIPMRFGTIFKSQKGVLDLLEKDFQNFRDILDKLQNKQEWGLKVYIKEDLFKKELKAKNKNLRLPKKANYFQELEKKEELEEIFYQESEAQARKILESLSKIAVGFQRNNNLAKELTGKSEPMILNAAFLLEKNKLELFTKKIKQLKKVHPTLIIDYTGPWPPYNFIE